MTKQGTILVVDDNKGILTAVQMLLGTCFEKVITISTPNKIKATLHDENIDVVLLDMNFSAGINTGNEGLFWLSEIKKEDASIQVVLFTAYADIDLAVRGIKEGAADFVVKPWDNAKLLETLKTAYNIRTSNRKGIAIADNKLVVSKESGMFWGESNAMQQLRSLIEKVARTDANILVTGENGTGKEMLAREIHLLSNRKKETLVPVDMGAITETLFESELFGHVKGAFTDARADRPGKFEVADNGTLFLDEIGEMPVELQAKLLRVLESGEFIKVGETRPTRVDVRLIAATNRDLEKEIAAGNFREDLYFRLSVFRIHLPSLRERPGDIAGYIRVFAAQFADKMGRRIDSIDADYIAALERHTWHGNVRELRNVVERSLIMAEGNALTVGCLSPEFHAASCDGSVPDSMALDALERHHILRVLEYTKGNKAEAARLLGIGIATLYRKLESYGMKP